MALLGACGGALRPALTGPEAGGPAWRELVTPSFVLRTDLPESEAREAIAEFERIERVFIDLSPGRPIPEPTAVLWFARQVDYDAVAPRPSIGFFMSNDRNSSGAPLIIFFGPFRDDTRRVFQHELTHRFVAQEMPHGAPVWLNEGLARYFETMQIAYGRLEIGRADWHFYPGPFPPRIDPIPLDELVASTPSEFYGPSEYVYYATSWAFVHMLRSKGAGYAPRFSKYIEALHGGVASAVAWREAFDGVSLRDLQVSFNNYITSPYVKIIAVKYEAPTPPAPRVRLLSADEVAELFRRLRSGHKRVGEGDAPLMAPRR